jgi:hypothetical protein
MFNPFVPGKTMNAGASLRKVSWVAAPELSGEHPIIHVHINNPAARTDNLALGTIGNVLDRVKGYALQADIVDLVFPE